MNSIKMNKQNHFTTIYTIFTGIRIEWMNNINNHLVRKCRYGLCEKFGIWECEKRKKLTVKWWTDRGSREAEVRLWESDIFMKFVNYEEEGKVRLSWRYGELAANGRSHSSLVVLSANRKMALSCRGTWWRGSEDTHAGWWTPRAREKELFLSHSTSRAGMLSRE